MSICNIDDSKAMQPTDGKVLCIAAKSCYWYYWEAWQWFQLVWRMVLWKCTHYEPQKGNTSSSPVGQHKILANQLTDIGVSITDKW